MPGYILLYSIDKAQTVHTLVSKVLITIQDSEIYLYWSQAHIHVYLLFSDNSKCRHGLTDILQVSDRPTETFTVIVDERQDLFHLLAIGAVQLFTK